MRISRARPRRARAAQKGAPPTRASPSPGTRSFDRFPSTATGRTSGGLYAGAGSLSSVRGGGRGSAAAEGADREREEEAHGEGGDGRAERERGGVGGHPGGRAPAEALPPDQPLRSHENAPPGSRHYGARGGAPEGIRAMVLAGPGGTGG